MRDNIVKYLVDNYDYDAEKLASVSDEELEKIVNEEKGNIEEAKVYEGVADENTKDVDNTAPEVPSQKSEDSELAEKLKLVDEAKALGISNANKGWGIDTLKSKIDAAKKIKAPSTSTDNADTETNDASDDTAEDETFVGFCRIPGGFNFILDDKDSLTGKRGLYLKSGSEVTKAADGDLTVILKTKEYGKTVVTKAEKEEIIAKYGKMRVFQKGYIFFAKTVAQGLGIASRMIDKAAAKGGFEQLGIEDIKASFVQPTIKSDVN